MKKGILQFITAFMLLAMVIPIVATNASAATNNFSKKTAKSLSNGNVCSVTCADTNTRWYKTSLTKDGYVGINVSSVNNPVQFSVFTGNKVLLTNQTLNTGNTYSTNIGVAKGSTVYVSVKALSSESTQFSVKLAKKSSSAWEKEINDSTSKATKLNLSYNKDKKYYGSNHSSSDKDYFTYTASQDMNIEIRYLSTMDTGNIGSTAQFIVKVNGATKLAASYPTKVGSEPISVGTYALKSGDKLIFRIANATNAWSYRLTFSSSSYSTDAEKVITTTDNGYTVETDNIVGTTYWFNKLKIDAPYHLEMLSDGSAIGGNITMRYLSRINLTPSDESRKYELSGYLPNGKPMTSAAQGLAFYAEHIKEQIPVYQTETSTDILYYIDAY